MTNDEIRKYFSVDKNSVEPLYCQLKSRIQEFIIQQPVNTRMPSERSLAAALQISRNSVKAALEYFTMQELLVSYDRRGSFTHPQPLQSPAPSSSPGAEVADPSSGRRASHVPGLFAGWPERATLRLLLFEDYFSMRRFWKNRIARFERTHPGLQVEIVWIPKEKRGAELTDYLAEHPCELIQLSSYVANVMDCLKPLPLTVRRRLECADSLVPMVLANGDERYRTHLFPVYFPYWVCFYNRELLTSHQVASLGDWLRGNDILEVLPRLKESCFGDWNRYLTNMASDLVLVRGLSEGYGEAELLQCFRQLYEFRNRHIVDHEVWWDPFNSVEQFLAGRQPLFFGYSNLCLDQLPDLPFQVGVEVMRPLPGLRPGVGASFLGVAGNARDSRVATAFLEFLLQPESAAAVHDELGGLPFVRPVAAAKLQQRSGLTAAAAEQLLEDHRVFQFGCLPEIIRLELADLFQLLCAGEITPEEALQELRLRKIFPAVEKLPNQ